MSINQDFRTDGYVRGPGGRATEIWLGGIMLVVEVRIAREMTAH